MNTYLDLEDSLYAVVNTGFATWTKIFAYGNGPEPVTPYLVIDVQKLTPIHLEERSDGIVDPMGSIGTATTVQVYEADVRFELVGKMDNNATLGEMAQQLDMFFRSQAAYESLEANRLSFMRCKPVRRMKAPRETDTYMYYQLDFTFGYAVVLTEDQYWIEIASPIVGVYHDAANPPDYTITSEIEIP